jgi:hypothetical protein
VITAVNGEVAADHPGDIDILVTCVVMPQMQGQEAADRIFPYDHTHHPQQVNTSPSRLQCARPAKGRSTAGTGTARPGQSLMMRS